MSGATGDVIMNSLAEIYFAPGEYLVTVFVQIFDLYSTDAQTLRMASGVTAFFVWLLALRLVIGVLARFRNTADRDAGGRSDGGPTIEKALGYLAFTIGVGGTVLTSPFLYNWLADPIFDHLAQAMDSTAAQALSWVVIALTMLAVLFFIQSAVHLVLYRLYIKILS